MQLQGVLKSKPGPILFCSEPSVAPSFLRVKTQVLPADHQALHRLSYHLPALVSFCCLPHSLCSNLTGLWAILSGSAWPQGLCTGCAFCLERASFRYPPPPLPFGLCSNITPSERPSSSSFAGFFPITQISFFIMYFLIMYI